MIHADGGHMFCILFYKSMLSRFTFAHPFANHYLPCNNLYQGGIVAPLWRGTAGGIPTAFAILCKPLSPPNVPYQGGNVGILGGGRRWALQLLSPYSANHNLPSNNLIGWDCWTPRWGMEAGIYKRMILQLQKILPFIIPMYKEKIIIVRQQK